MLVPPPSGLPTQLVNCTISLTPKHNAHFFNLFGICFGFFRLALWLNIFYAILSVLLQTFGARLDNERIVCTSSETNKLSHQHKQGFVEGLVNFRIN